MKKGKKFGNTRIQKKRQSKQMKESGIQKIPMNEI